MSELPTGTVTFLFTDIEGSTKLWEHAPETMEAALKRHDALLRNAIESRGGRVFKTIGDAFCAAFASAHDALAAALAGQRTLNTETWDEALGAVRVRMGLHTGVVEAREDDYFGPAVNRVARLEAAGHGGQILLSLATQELVRDALPSGVRLLDLGEHRLKDLFRPEHIFQVAAPDLPADFPPLRTLDVLLTNLPAQPTPFIGRDRELAAVLGLLRREDVRLVSLTGAGGTGKTRLALQAAADVLDAYEHGVFFVDLAPIRDPDLVLPTVASTLGVKEEPDKALLDTLKDHLRGRQMLLVLDNFEQVVKAAPMVADLLAAAPRLKVLVTSREVLRLYGEHDYPVPPLGLPEIRRKQTVAVLSQYEAVALFIQRAKAAKPDFEITEENAPAVAEICVRLDGLPLAIELAAARSRLLAPDAMLERLSNRLQALRGGARDLPARQQTLRGAIDWSYDLLDEDEKTLFARLGVFVGGWALEAAEAICGEGLPFDVLDGLESLLDKSLIRYAESAGGEMRFTMLETIREYAGERLGQSDDDDAIQKRHTAYYLNWAEQFMALIAQQGLAAAVSRTNEEHDNLRAALGRSLEAGDAETALRMCMGLWEFWSYFGHTTEGRRWLERAFENPGDLPGEVRAGGLKARGNLAWAQGDNEEARRHYEESLALYRELDDRDGISACLNNLANIASEAGDYALARRQYEESLALYAEMGSKTGVATAVGNLAHLACKQGDFALSRRYAEQALTLAREMGHEGEPYVAWMLLQLGRLARAEDDDAQAQALLEESEALCREADFAQILAQALTERGRLAIQQGDPARARECLRESLTILREIEAKLEIAIALTAAASLATAQSHVEQAVRLFGAAEALFEAIHVVIPPTERGEIDGYLAPIHGELAPAAFDALWAEGQAMSWEEAITYALRE
jgi:predicted ATPase/class 3 adenylate cyclase